MSESPFEVPAPELPSDETQFLPTEESQEETRAIAEEEPGAKDTFE